MTLPTATYRRLRQGWRLALAGWILFFAGLGTVLFDTIIPLPGHLSWLGYGFCVTGAALFALSTVLRSPPAPAFLESAPDPWETGSRGVGEPQ